MCQVLITQLMPEMYYYIIKLEPSALSITSSQPDYLSVKLSLSLSNHTCVSDLQPKHEPMTGRFAAAALLCGEHYHAVPTLTPAMNA